MVSAWSVEPYKLTAAACCLKHAGANGGLVRSAVAMTSKNAGSGLERSGGLWPEETT